MSDRGHAQGAAVRNERRAQCVRGGGRRGGRPLPDPDRHRPGPAGGSAGRYRYVRVPTPAAQHPGVRDAHEHGGDGERRAADDTFRLGAARDGVRQSVSLLLPVHLSRRHHHHCDARAQCAARQLGRPPIGCMSDRIDSAVRSSVYNKIFESILNRCVCVLLCKPSPEKPTLTWKSITDFPKPTLHLEDTGRKCGTGEESAKRPS